MPTLIDRYEDLAWLQPWMKGAADWKIGVRIPAAVGKRQRRFAAARFQ